MAVKSEELKAEACEQTCECGCGPDCQWGCGCCEGTATEQPKQEAKAETKQERCPCCG